MSTEIMTRDGTPSVVEANLALAVEQGRIGEGDKDRWRRHYQKVGYEAATQDLISRKIALNAAPAKSYSEQQWEAYARMTGVIRDWGYSRSVV
jgi:hypothetical protein